jgi:hypothetical protein
MLPTLGVRAVLADSARGNAQRGARAGMHTLLREVRLRSAVCGGITVHAR